MKMKFDIKWLIVLLLPAIANNFDGYYIGLSAGPISTIFSSKISQDNMSIKSLNKVNTNGYVYGLISGYGKTFNNLYGGVEIGIYHNTSFNGDKNFYYRFDNQNCVIKTEYRSSPIVSIGPRLGFLLNDITMIYIKPSLEMNRVQIKLIDDEGMPIFSKKQMKYSFVPSIGLELYCMNNFLVRVEYGYNFGSKIYFMINNDNYYYNIKYKAHFVKLGIVYKF